MPASLNFWIWSWTTWLAVVDTSMLASTTAIASGLGAGWRSNRVKSCRVWDAVIAGVFPPDTPSFQAQEPQRHQAERHMVVPADPTADLVVIEPGLAVARLEHFLDPVPLPL